MSKKIIFSIIVLVALVFSFTYVFAADMITDAANTIDDSMDKTGDSIENAGNAVMNTANDVVSGARNVVNDTAAGVGNAVQDITDNDNRATTTGNAVTGNTNNYSATRTATDTNEGTLLGMNSTAWTWIILGLAAIAIVALVWYYSTQFTNRGYHDGEE